MKSTLDFLRDEVYLPRYMTLQETNYSNDQLDFSFKPVEPEVTQIHLGYVTPRGLHITLSQAGVYIAERIAEEYGLVDQSELRSLTLDARLKITRLDQRFRREIEIKERLEGRMHLDKVRAGKMPIFQLGFTIDGGSIRGMMAGALAPRPVLQTNQDVMRGKKA